jgi:GntR family transcriptional regulator, carbon starvation induced regulator
MANETVARGQSEALSYTAYDLLREDIVSGRFEPESKLRIDQLCELYRVGASPMREALSRLAETGLIVSEPQRGYWVAPVSLEEYQDLVTQRLNLEVPALADSIKNGDVEWESKVVGAYHRLSRSHAKLDGSKESFIAWAKDDRAFHFAALEKCSSPWLLRFCRLIYDQLSRYHRQRYLVGITPGDQNESEHEKLLKAILDRDVERATTSLTKHIRAASRRLLKEELAN